MTQSDDLSKLFQRFGGKTESYKEIVREDATTSARERWPLLSAIEVDRAVAVPPVQSTTLRTHDLSSQTVERDVPRELRWHATPSVGDQTAPVSAAEAPAIAALPASPLSSIAARFRAPDCKPSASVQAVRAQPPNTRVHVSVRPLADHVPLSDTALSMVFARIESSVERPVVGGRAPARRSFLSRLNRS